MPDDHLAWFVIEAVNKLDLSDFYGAYRQDGHGQAAYEPSMMVALVIYAYARGVRSSREIERRCFEVIPFRVITANQAPDHATIARFIARHEAALGELFGQVLTLCAKAGLVGCQVVAIDGTRLAANASPEANCDYHRIAQEIIASGRATDEAEDERYGEARGDELPPALQTEAARREWLRQAIEELDSERAAKKQADASAGSDERPDPAERSAFDTERIVARMQGREGWLREAKRQLELRRWRQAQPIPRSRLMRLADAGRRLEEDLSTERCGNEAYEHYRATGRMKNGRRLGAPPKPYRPPSTPAGKVNVTDPDSKQIKTNAGFGWLQGYNAQAAVNERDLVLAAEITNNTADYSQLDPIVSAMLGELEQAGVRPPQVVTADAGFWNEEHMDEIVANKHIQVLVPPDAGNRTTPRPGWTGGRYDWMRRVLSSALGQELYRRRKQMIEPVFGHTKHNRGVRRFHRRGRLAVRTEWRLLMTTHNLIKLHKHRLGLAAA